MLVVVVIVAVPHPLVAHQHVELRLVAIRDVQLHRADVTQDATQDVPHQVVVVKLPANQLVAHLPVAARRNAAVFWLDFSAAKRAAVLLVANQLVVATPVALLHHAATRLLRAVATPVVLLQHAATQLLHADVTPVAILVAATLVLPAVATADVHRLAAIVHAAAF